MQGLDTSSWTFYLLECRVLECYVTSDAAKDVIAIVKHIQKVQVYIEKQWKRSAGEYKNEFCVNGRLIPGHPKPLGNIRWFLSIGRLVLLVCLLDLVGWCHHFFGQFCMWLCSDYSCLGRKRWNLMPENHVEYKCHIITTWSYHQHSHGSNTGQPVQ